MGLLRQREPWYRGCADLAASTDGRTPDEVADEIAAAWEKLMMNDE